MPNQKNIYIIGDVHGCYKTLRALIDKLPQKEQSHICFVGDVIDRGKDSKKIIEFIQAHYYDCVLGNHEEMMIEQLPLILKKNNAAKYSWFTQYGGDATIESYDNNIALLNAHLNWLKTLPLYLQYPHLKTSQNRHLVVSHSHILQSWKYKNCPKDSPQFQKFKNECLYSRFKEHEHKKIFNVFGHTPVEKVTFYKSGVDIDLGCCYKNQPKKGKLCALEFPSMKTFIQKNIEN
jgi:serine/threonine protein phosphatase 1